MSMIWVWTIVIGVSLIIEFITWEMVSVWLALGGIVGLILAAVGGVSIEAQIIVFVCVSIAAILGLRKITLKFMNRNSNSKEAETLLSKKVKLLADTDEDFKSTAKLNGVEWTVIANEKLKKGTEVVIKSTVGNKLKVEKCEETKPAETTKKSSGTAKKKKGDK